jgi:hypothetical protein
VSEFHKLLQKFKNEYGDIMKFRAGSSWVVAVANPEYSKRVLGKPEKFPERPMINILDVYQRKNNMSPGLAVL